MRYLLPPSESTTVWSKSTRFSETSSPFDTTHTSTTNFEMAVTKREAKPQKSGYIRGPNAGHVS